MSTLQVKNGCHKCMICDSFTVRLNKQLKICRECRKNTGIDTFAKLKEATGLDFKPKRQARVLLPTGEFGKPENCLHGHRICGLCGHNADSPRKLKLNAQIVWQDKIWSISGFNIFDRTYKISRHTGTALLETIVEQSVLESYYLED